MGMGSSTAANSRSSLKICNGCGAGGVVLAGAAAGLMDEAAAGQEDQEGQAAVPQDPPKRATGRHGHVDRNNARSHSAIRCLETRAVIRVREEDNPCTMPRLLH